jgi:hypothetical protein
MSRVWAGWIACLWVLSAPLAAGMDASRLVLARGSRVGVVTVLDPEVTHYHSGKSLRDGFLKTETVDWSVSGMFIDALKDRAAQLGLVLVPLQETEELDRAREACFLNGNFAKGLPKDCAAPLEHLGSTDGIQALLVLAPAVNNSTHGGALRRKGLPDYLRGWGYVTGEAGAPDGKPSLFSMTEMLVVTPSAEGPQLRAREWGGNDALEWTTFVAPPDVKAIPMQDYAQLRPFFAAMLSQQTARLLDQIEIGP